MIHAYSQEFCIVFQAQLSLLFFFWHHDAEILLLIPARAIFFETFAFVSVGINFFSRWSISFERFILYISAL